MIVMNYAELRKEINNLIHIYVPKLEAIANGGSGATIHRANELIGFIYTNYEIAKLCHKNKDSSAITKLFICREYIRTAEMWMEDLAKEK